MTSERQRQNQTCWLACIFDPSSGLGKLCLQACEFTGRVKRSIPGKYKLALAGLLWISSIVSTFAYWRWAFLLSEQALCVAKKITPCTSQPLLSVLASPLKPTEGERPPTDASWALAGIVVLMAVLAFAMLTSFSDFKDNYITDLEKHAEKDRPSTEPPASFPAPVSWLIHFFWWFPAAFFFGGLIQHGYPDAAAITIALVAIYVAAEHFASLEKQSKRVAEQEHVLREKVANIENALGTPYGTQLIYDAYARKPEGSAKVGQPIFAIFKFFKVDDVWWTKEWKDYQDLRSRTLHYVLKSGQRREVTIVASFFVEDTAKPSSGSIPFGQFIGLIWHWVILKTAFDDKEGNRNEIYVAQTQQWLHVVDDHVFQILGDQLEGLKVRSLTFDLRESGNLLSEWAKKEIQQISLRGTRAQDYICATLLSTRQYITHDHTIPFKASDDMLEEIGFNAWWTATPVKDVDQTIVKKKCRELIERFVTLVCKGSNAGDCEQISIDELGEEIE